MNRGEFSAMKQRLAEQDKENQRLHAECRALSDCVMQLSARVEALESRPALPVNRVRAGEKANA
jgi:predicted nuclease with TOPRIM domain